MQYQFKNNIIQQRNKQNSLSFRNIAANQHSQSQKRINLTQLNKPSFQEQHSQLWRSKQNLQQELHYVGSCFNHANKLAEYVQTISLHSYCKLCAAKMASRGYQFEKSQNFVSRDNSPTLSQMKKIQSMIQLSDQFETNQQKGLINNTKNKNIPVKFSTLISQKNKKNENIEFRYQENEILIEQYYEIYTQKMERLQDLINDIRIKDTQYLNKLKSQNKSILQGEKQKKLVQKQNIVFDMLGKSLIKDSKNQKLLQFKLPSDQRIQFLQTILKFIEQKIKQNEKSQFSNNIPLIKSINSKESKNDKSLNLKNSSSFSNLSNKSIFKKDKQQNSKQILNQKQEYGIKSNQLRIQNIKSQIENSRFSTNSAIIRKKNNKMMNEMKTEGREGKRKKLEESLQDSNSCQDTPQSLKSKISSNSFMLPRNVAVTMFEKINVCQSIDVGPIIKQNKMQQNENKIKQQMYNKMEVTSIQMIQRISSNLNGQNIQKRAKMQNSIQFSKSDNNSISVKSKDRKSFNRYQNIQVD